mgnify:CR=1 FL=1
MKHWAVAGLILFALLQRSVAGDEDFGTIIKEFAKNRHALENQLSKQLKLPIPAAVSNFFRAAEAGDWSAISNAFDRLHYSLEPMASMITELQNELYAPIQETDGIYSTFDAWATVDTWHTCEPFTARTYGYQVPTMR